MVDEGKYAHGIIRLPAISTKRVFTKIEAVQ
jgi:hypothetical protein